MLTIAILFAKMDASTMNRVLQPQLSHSLVRLLPPRLPPSAEDNFYFVLTAKFISVIQTESLTLVIYGELLI